MGWVNSPPLFCSLTETICDLANARMHRRYAPPHRQESLAARDDVINATGLATSDSIGDAQVSELRPETQDQVSDSQSADTSQRSAPAELASPPTKPPATQRAPTSCEEDERPFSALPAPEQVASNKPLPKPSPLTTYQAPPNPFLTRSWDWAMVLSTLASLYLAGSSTP